MDDDNDSGVDTLQGLNDDQSLHVPQEQVVSQQHEDGEYEEDDVLQPDPVEESRCHDNQGGIISDPSVDLLIDGDFLSADDVSRNYGESEENNAEDRLSSSIDSEGADSNENDDRSELSLLGNISGSYYAIHSPGSMDESSDSDEESRRSENRSSRHDDILDTPQPAKNHPYLPTAQPLFPEEWISAEKQWHWLDRDDGNGELIEDNSSSLETTSLAIFEIDDIVLFPGEKLPLRVSDRNWVAYLGALIDDARELHGSRQGTGGHMGEVRMVILPHVTTGTRRSGRRRPREGRGTMGRWRVDLIRLGVTALRSRAHARRRASERIEIDSGHHPSRSETDLLESAGADIGESSQQLSDEESDNGIFRPAVRPALNDDPLIGRIGTMATITFTHEETILTRGMPQGRRSSRAEELVLTVLGTQRCRLLHPDKDETNKIPVYFIEPINDGSASLPPSWILQPPGNAKFSITIPTVNSSRVEIEEEGDPSVMWSSRRGVHEDGLNNAIRNLAFRSSTPAIAYHAIWPWKLCQKICNLIQEEQFKGLRVILPSAAGLRCEENGHMIEANAAETSTASSIQVLDPSAFSNWISSNMPLSQDDRLDLLDMTCTVQQLRFIIQKLDDKRQESMILRCKHCGATISQMKHIFFRWRISGDQRALRQ
ncbi:hypothetical protein ACHAXA_009166 [Cyclostephanos tholiformis]|uniref:Uncharacterized protein n=1 Tax=Cyclostephanos tholiformis TaxID=382380 RepID=A0ABD3RTB2_9STRA